MEALGIQHKEIGATVNRTLSAVQGSYTYFANGDVLLAKITPCFENGKLGIASGLTNGVGFGSSEYIVMRPSACLTADFLYYFLLQDSFREVGAKNMTGTAGQKRVTKTYVESSGIPIPPLQEQERIVAILDEAFEAIATAKANAEKSMQNAQEFIDSWMQFQFTSGGKQWIRVRLGDTGSSISTGPFGTMLHKADYVEDGIPLVNPMNIEGSTIVPSSKMMVSPSTKKRLESYILRKGDVVIARRGELGRCAVVTEEEDGWLCGTGSFFVRLSSRIDEHYFTALFRSRALRNVLDQNSIGTTMSNLNHGILNALELFLPPVQEQRKIMARADELATEVDRIRTNNQQRIKQLDTLKQSLLHQAFTGKL